MNHLIHYHNLKCKKEKQNVDYIMLINSKQKNEQKRAFLISF